MTELDVTVLDLCRLDRERYLCALCAPHVKRDGLIALIAFNQELADIVRGVSEPMLGKIKLQWWIDVLAGIVQGRPPAHPVARALAQLRGVDGQLNALRALVEARNFELEPGRPQSLNDLEAFARASGGGLHGLMVDVLGVEGEETRAAAQEVGTAWALIGVMRALPYPAEAARDMLPQNATVQEVLGRAQTLLDVARKRTPPKSALPALLTARLADRHLKRFARQGWDPAQREEPPTGAGAVASIWLGKWTGRY